MSERCGECSHYQYDEEDECCYCEADIDEDDAVRLAERAYKECPFFSLDDEYAVVKKQM